MRILALLLFAMPAYADMTWPNPTGCATQVADMMQLAIDEHESDTDLDGYYQSCSGRVCRLHKLPVKVTWDTPYGEQDVIVYQVAP